MTSRPRKPNLNDDKSQLPWVEKYRPQRLEELVAHENIIKIITNLIDSDNLPHLLLYGPPGTGKTSTIVAAAKRMYGPTKYNSMTLELNASDARGINVVRNEIKEFAGTKQLFSKGVKLIILDEADAMTSDAQFALRRVIEKYTKNARFCLICNYVSKIIPALQSRCTRFRFAPLLPEQIQQRLIDIAAKEHVPLTDSGVAAILDLSNGDMRRVLNLLQSTAMSNIVTADTPTDADADTDAAEVDEDSKMDIDTPEPTAAAIPTMIPIDENAVYLTSGSPLPKDIDVILTSLLNDTFREALTTISALCTTNGYALVDVLALLTTKLITMKGLDPIPLGRLLDGMSQVECRLSSGSSSGSTDGTEKIQTASLVGIFVETRQSMVVVSAF